MAVKNSIAPAKEQKTNVITYISNGEEVNLSGAMIRDYLVSGGGEVSNQEIMMFLSLCRFQHLNPFIREAYLIKYGSQPATIVVSKDVFVKRARKNKDFAGMSAGIIVRTEQGFEEREGTFYDPESETVVGGWAKVFIKGYERPIYESVPIHEYEGKTKEGKTNSQWATKGATMIRKVALMHALREAFPDDTAGMYIQEEMPEIQDIVLPEVPVAIPEDTKEQPTAEQAEAKGASAALFGE